MNLRGFRYVLWKKYVVYFLFVPTKDTFLPVKYSQDNRYKPTKACRIISTNIFVIDSTLINLRHFSENIPTRNINMVYIVVRQF